jgi:hypothetical protein
MAFPPQFQQNQAQRASPTMCRGRGMIWNRRQGVTGAAATRRVMDSHFRSWFRAPLFWPLEANKKVPFFKRLE